ncbi:MAG: hypothetical protein GY768_00050 [Planctomycetaceae bacterium]|nr:hypothetical protein [Planctomycetaceae bacterium]
MKTTLKMFFALVLMCAISSQALADVHDGLINYWNFDGNFDDTAGSIAGNNSTKADNGSQPAAAVSLANWTDINPDAAALGQYGVFDGSAEGYIEVPDSADIVRAGGAVSISAWLQVNNFDQGWQALIAHGEGSDYRIARRGGGSNIISYAGGTGDIPTNDSTGPDINDGNWHHVVAISPIFMDQAASQLWVDGVQVATGGNAVLGDNGSGRLMIGGNPDTLGDGYRTWDGAIEDVGMWDRPLTGSEIESIFTSGQNGIPLAAIPEPSAGLLVMLAAGALPFFRRRRR